MDCLCWNHHHHHQYQQQHSVLSSARILAVMKFQRPISLEGASKQAVLSTLVFLSTSLSISGSFPFTSPSIMFSIILSCDVAKLARFVNSYFLQKFALHL